MRAIDTNEMIPTFGPHIDAAIARLDAPVPARPPRDARTERSVVREGILAGTFAAAVVAVGFAVVDARIGERLYTPTLLGTTIGRLLGIEVMADSATGAVLGYTVLHVSAFILLATVVAGMLRRARSDLPMLGAALLLFAVVELAFAGLVAMLAEVSAAAAMAWPQLALGNVLGWLALTGWMWHAHPEVPGEFADMVNGADPSH